MGIYMHVLYQKTKFMVVEWVSIYACIISENKIHGSGMGIYICMYYIRKQNSSCEMFESRREYMCYKAESQKVKSFRLNYSTMDMYVYCIIQHGIVTWAFLSCTCIDRYFLPLNLPDDVSCTPSDSLL